MRDKSLQGLTVHPTKKQALEKFLWVLLILIVYGLFLIYRFGQNGFLLTALTWSAFVLATPIADAGVLVDFPVRFVTGLRMVYSEIIVWIAAIALNVVTLAVNPAVYHKTAITTILKKILLNPYPFWAIIVLSCIGTFLSIAFADELLDIKEHSEIKLFYKYGFIVRTVTYILAFALFYLVYRYFLELFGIAI